MLLVDDVSKVGILERICSKLTDDLVFQKLYKAVAHRCVANYVVGSDTGLPTVEVFAKGNTWKMIAVQI